MATTEEPPYLYLTTIGRRSRVPREIEIWFTRRDGRYYVISREKYGWGDGLVVELTPAPAA